MGLVELASALADPQHVSRAVVPAVGEGIAAREGLFVGEDQGLMGGVEVDLGHAGIVGRANAAGFHEPQGTIDLVGDRLIAPSLGAGRDELLVPDVHLLKICVAALGERTDQVQGRCRLLVGAKQSLGFWHARLGIEGDVVDHVPAKGRKFVIAAALHIGRARFGKLAGDTSHFDDWNTGRIGEHGGHLQNDFELVADAVCSKPVEALSTVPSL